MIGNHFQWNRANPSQLSWKLKRTLQKYNAVFPLQELYISKYMKQNQTKKFFIKTWNPFEISENF